MTDEDRRIYQEYVNEVLEERRLVRRIERLVLLGTGAIAIIVLWLL